VAASQPPGPMVSPEPACPQCGRPLFWAGDPGVDGDQAICAECDAAINFDSLEGY